MSRTSQTAASVSKQNHSIPLSNGIIEHRKKIGSAIWLFIQLIDWTTAEEDGIGRVFNGAPVKAQQIMEALDIKERQVSSQLHRLKNRGYIGLKRTSYGYIIVINKSKKFVNRDRQKVAALPPSDQHKTADQDPHKSTGLTVEIGNNPQVRSAIYCRNKEDITIDLTKKREATTKSAKLIPALSKSEDFERAWSRYPKRAGSNPKRAAYAKWQAQLRSGVSSGELLAGVECYARYIRATGKERTELVMQAQRFFGPNEEWKNDWTLPSNSGRAAGGFVA